MAGLRNWLLAACTLAVVPVAPAWAGPTADRGELVFRVAGCENCHTDREHGGARLAGGRKLATPLGTFYTPNITPDPVTGIGRWSEDDFRRALRDGVGPDGRHYYPSFPYTSYTRMNDADIHALWGYLRAQPAVHQADRDHDLPWYLGFRPLLAVWKWLFFTPGAYQPVAGKSAAWNRGAYLVQGAGHCAECHTPRNRLGGFKKGLELAGTLEGPDGLVVPNITPDRQYGIGAWCKADLAAYLGTGNRPDGDCAGSLMAELIDNGLKYLAKVDLDAIAEYVAGLPASANPARKPGKGGNKRRQEDY